METLEGLSKTLATKISLLRFTQEEVPKTLKKAHLPSMERLRNVVKDKVEEIHKLKVRVTEIRIEEGVNTDNIREENETIEASIDEFENTASELDAAIKQAKQLEKRQTREEEEYLATQVRKQRYEDEMKFEEAKLQQKLRYEKKIDEDRAKQSQTGNTKLPKLVITKFNGTHTDWIRFWNQFETEIEKADVSKVTKFSYLKELLEPKVRMTVDGLPFTTEGYERAKNILKSKYGKPGEIVNAYVNNIMALPNLTGSNSAQIYEFYEKLVNSVQSLETLGKLREVNGYVRHTLDKLECIRGDLVRTDDDWQEWDFPKLIEALRKWTERNPPKIDDRKSDRNQRDKSKHGRSYQTRQQEWKARPCVYCSSEKHKSIACDKITKTEERKKYLGEKQLCFNCTAPHHKAADCRSKSGCQKCRKEISA